MIDSTMTRVSALLLVFLAVPATAQQTKTVTYQCRGGSVSVTATIDRSKGYEAWADGKPLILRVPGQPPQTLTEDKTDPDGATWRNRDYQFYSFKKFTNVSRYVGGRPQLMLNACR